MPGVKRIIPMFAQLGDEQDLKLKNYIFEPKLDGIRALCYVTKSLKFITRNGITITDQYPEFDFRKLISAKTVILDGEIIMYDKHGNPNFSLLQRRALPDDQTDKKNATYVVFDVVMVNGRWLTDVPLTERKKILKKIIAPRAGLLEVILYTSKAMALWKAAQKHNLEGVMAKEKNSHYYPGKRTNAWIKIKRSQTVDCVIIGFTQERRHISALLLGLYDHGVLRFIGKVGTGFNQENIEILYNKLKKMTRKTPLCPCPHKLVTWVRPILVCEVKYGEWTRDKKLRAPVFLRLRTDKSPKSCTFKGQI